MKKLKCLSVVLLVALVMSFSVQVFAAPTSPGYNPSTPPQVEYAVVDGKSVPVSVTPIASGANQGDPLGAEVEAAAAALKPNGAIISMWDIAEPEGHVPGTKTTVVLTVPGLLEGDVLSVVHYLGDGLSEVLPITSYTPHLNRVTFDTTSFSPFALISEARGARLTYPDTPHVDGTTPTSPQTGVYA